MKSFDLYIRENKVKCYHSNIFYSVILSTITLLFIHVDISHCEEEYQTNYDFTSDDCYINWLHEKINEGGSLTKIRMDERKTYCKGLALEKRHIEQSNECYNKWLEYYDAKDKKPSEKRKAWKKNNCVNKKYNKDLKIKNNNQKNIMSDGNIKIGKTYKYSPEEKLKSKTNNYLKQRDNIYKPKHATPSTISPSNKLNNNSIISIDSYTPPIITPELNNNISNNPKSTFDSCLTVINSYISNLRPTLQVDEHRMMLDKLSLKQVKETKTFYEIFFSKEVEDVWNQMNSIQRSQLNRLTGEYGVSINGGYINVKKKRN